MLGRHCEASEEVGADSFIMPPGTLCMHRKPYRVEGGPVFDWLTEMLRPVSHMNWSLVSIPICMYVCMYVCVCMYARHEHKYQTNYPTMPGK